MLSISALPNVHYYYTDGVFPSNRNYNIGYYPESYGTLPKIIFVTNPNKTPPTPVSSEIQLGWIKHGTKLMGALRDKDVQHLNVQGSIVCNSDYAKALFPNDLIVIWGQDATWTTNVPIGPDRYIWFQDRNRLFDWQQSNVSHTIRVKFDGNDCVVTYFRSLLSFYISPWTYLNSYPSYAYVRWYTLAGGSSNNIVCSPEYSGQSNYDNTVMVSLPSGATAFTNISSPRAATYGVPLNSSKSTVVDANDISTADSGVLTLQRTKDIIAALNTTWLWNSFELYPDLYDTSELGIQILSDLKYVDANFVLTFVDLVRMKSQLLGWKDLFQSFSALARNSARLSMQTFDQAAKELYIGGKLSSNAYLGFLYGVKPMKNDIVKFISGLVSLRDFLTIPQRLHTRHSTVVAGPKGHPITTTSVLTVQMRRCSDDTLERLDNLIHSGQGWDMIPAGLSILDDANRSRWMDIIREAKRWGSYPNALALLDAIPYSFVAGWLINLSETFSKVDAYYDKDYYPIEYAITSQKRVWTLPLEEVLPKSWGSGNVTICYYYRELASELPLPPVQVGVKVGPNSHWLEAGAMVVQKASRLI